MTELILSACIQLSYICAVIETQGDCVPTQVAGADEMSESERVRAGTGHAGIR